MADFTIKPASGTGNKLILQTQAETDVMTTSDSGVTLDSATLNSPTLVTPALGTPASGVVTNLSGVLPVGVTGGSGLTALGTVATGNLSNTAIVYPAGHVLRSFYDENTDGGYTVTTTYGDWASLDITITGPNSTSDYLQIWIFLASVYNSAADGRYIKIGARYSIDDWSNDVQFGTQEFYDRPAYSGNSTAIVVDATVPIRFAHPTTSTYRVRPWLGTAVGNMTVGQTSAESRSTITAFEIKG